jgi:hypothetical protein
MFQLANSAKKETMKNKKDSPMETETKYLLLGIAGGELGAFAASLGVYSQTNSLLATLATFLGITAGVIVIGSVIGGANV